VAFSRLETELRLRGRLIALEDNAVTATVGRAIGERFSIHGTLGAITNGEAHDAGVRHSVGVGVLGAVQGSARLIAEGLYTPSLSGTAGFALTTASTSGGGVEARIIAADARVGLIIGKSFFERFGLYAAARGFAGPVSWSQTEPALGGGGVQHHQIGFGGSVRLPEGLRLFGEWAAIGEGGFTVGVGWELGTPDVPLVAPPPTAPPTRPPETIIGFL
jgi:hypothetical protein